MDHKLYEGWVFTRLTLTGKSEKTKSGNHWECRCQCGNMRWYSAYNLMSGKCKSCGCLKDENTGKRSRTHGASVGGKLTGTYYSWRKMKERCHNPKAQNYAWYGAKGVTVCERWRKSFENFLADMGERPLEHTIERKNVFGNYEPENCYWLHKSKQWKNKRKSPIT